MDERRTDDTARRFPARGGALILPLIPAGRREQFSPDLRRGRTRIDLGSRPHRNPDGEKNGSPHLHLYREGFGDKWAYPLPSDSSDPSDSWQTPEEFLRFCDTAVVPKIQRGVFP